jgi:hypothetical protein
MSARTDATAPEEVQPFRVEHALDRGGHFAAREQPQLLAEEVRVGFRSLR